MTTTRLDRHDVRPQLFVLRDVDESCEYEGVSWEQEPSFQKPVAQTHPICRTRMDGGHGEFVLTHHSRGRGRYCRQPRASAVRTMARTRVCQRRSRG